MPDQPCITAAALARRLGGTLDGNGECVIRDVATLELASQDSLSWVANAELLSRVAKSKAGVLLVPEGLSVPTGRTVIRVADPDAALCEVLEYLGPPPARVTPGVHPTATIRPEAVVEDAAIGAYVYVGERALIGPGTQLHPGVYVGADVSIGHDCVMWPNVVVRERVTIGDRAIIHPNSTIGADGYGYLQRDGKNCKIPQVGSVVIEDDVEIGANSAVDRARSGVTRIGRGTKIDNLVQIAHNVDIGEHCIMVGQSGLGGSTSLGHHVAIGGQTGVIDHQHIGNGVQIAAKSVVMHDIADGQVIRGIPAIDNRRFLREQASVRKLPEWMQRLRELTHRVERLEGQAGHTTQDSS